VTLGGEVCGTPKRTVGGGPSAGTPSLGTPAVCQHSLSPPLNKSIFSSSVHFG